MAIAVEVSFHGADATIERYFEGIKLMGAVPEGPHPDPGCLFHWVRSDPGGVFVTDVWTSKEQLDKFAAEKIIPVNEQVGLPKPQIKVIADPIDNFLTAGS